MRGLLLDWLVDVHGSFKLGEQTLALAVRYLDEFMGRQQISKRELQLLGATCLWIASKFEEIYPPRLKHFVEVTASSYSREEFLAMESRVLEALRFQLIKTTAYSVLELVFKKEVASKFGCLSRYLADMASTGGLTSRYRPSVIAIAAVGLAESILKAEHPK